jgi:ADP-heptose:LPS heptosyltransferase
VILALRALGIGDLATAVPALRALRAAHPDEALALVVPGWLRPLVELVDGVDTVVERDGLDGPGLPPLATVPSLAVNLHGRGPQSHRLLTAAQPARLWAFACPAAGHDDGPRWIDDEHEVHRWCRLLAWYGLSPNPADLALRRPERPATSAGASIVHPGGKEGRRRWPPDRFAAVARALDRAGHRVVITGSTGERPVAQQVARIAGLPSEAVLAGQLDLADLAALVASGRLVVSADTGVGHLATAFGTPSVLLFGPEPPSRWGPPPQRRWHRVLWHEGLASLPYEPDDEGVHPALAAITPDDVLDAVSGLSGTNWVRHAVTTG